MSHSQKKGIKKSLNVEKGSCSARKQIVLFVGLLMVLLAVAFIHALQTRKSADSVSVMWGLRYRKEGEAPIGKATVEDLAKYDAYYLGDTSKKVIYLTIDCGYENGYTEQIMDTLKKHNAPAAFFVTGAELKYSPDIVCRMAEEGFVVGSHTFNHPDVDAISQQEFQEEMENLAQLYQKTTGQPIARFYRSPMGKLNPQNLKQAQALGYKTIYWSIAYQDWDINNQPSAEQAFEELLPRTHNGAIVLLHAVSQTSAEILDELLTQWEEMGYYFASLKELPGIGEEG